MSNHASRGRIEEGTERVQNEPEVGSLTKTNISNQVNRASETSTRKAKKKPRIHPEDKLTVILFIVVIVGAITYYSYQSTSSTTSTTSTVQSFIPIPYNMFNLTNTTGCLTRKGTQTYEYYVITVTNRPNETIHYINASIQIGVVTFLDYHYPDISRPAYLLQPIQPAQPTDAVNWTFPIYFPMSGTSYTQFGTYYARTNVQSGLFGIAIYIRIDNHVEGPFLIDHPDLQASYLAPQC